MAKATRNSRLETRTARNKLKARKGPYWISIGRALHLGYRKGKKGGSWIARVYHKGKYLEQKLGKADDYQDPNNLDVLNYFQAQERARQFANDCAKASYGKKNAPLTVAEAVNNYLAWYQVHRKAYDRTKYTVDTHILPQLGSGLLDELTSVVIRHWHEDLAKCPPRLRSSKAMGVKYASPSDNVEASRKRKATANRILTVLKAALNHTWRDGYVENDEAWRRVKPFHNVDAPKVQYLSVVECERLLNACEPDFRNLVHAALLTGCRYGELTQLRVNDFNKQRRFLHINETKNGKPRHVPLTDEGFALFELLTIGRLGDEHILKRQDGASWGVSHQKRRLENACKIAHIKPAISFHVLRHTYGSILASKGVPLQVIAELLGHSDTRITSRHYAHLLPSYVADTLRAHLPKFSQVNESNLIGIKQ